MRDFFKTFFAAFFALAVFTGGLFILVIGVVVAIGASSSDPAASVPARAVLVFNLDTPIPDSYPEDSPQALMRQSFTGKDGRGLPLATLIATLDRAAQDKAISGLFLTGNINAQGYASGPAALKELQEALLRFKAKSGKPVFAYNLNYTKSDLQICSTANKLFLNPAGAVDMTGIVSEPIFFAKLFQKYGVDVQVTRVGKYKSAVEPFLLDKLSAENREQLQKLLGDLWNDWKVSVAENRKCAPEALQALADAKGVLLPREALEAGIVDQIAAYDEVLDTLKSLSGKRASDTHFPQITIEDYAKVPYTPKNGERIAVVYAEGDIVDGDGEDGAAGGDRISAEIRKLRLDDSVKAIVLRVNSPGGSAAASDLIQREVILARKAKPVVVSMGHLAASGGYWISAYANHIFAEPNSITGSIGVFGLMPNAKKLANDHGITWDSVQTAALAPPSMARPRTPAELARVQILVDDIYDQFLTKVAEGRKMTKESVHAIAQGRIWSGREAKKLGLVDDLGGLRDAIHHAAKLAKIEHDYQADVPEPAKNPIETFIKLVGGAGKRKMVKQGPVARLRTELEQTAETLYRLDAANGVYARMPFDLSIH